MPIASTEFNRKTPNKFRRRHPPILDIGQSDQLQLVAALHQCLSTSPYYVILSGYPPSEDREHVETLANAICDFAIDPSIAALNIGTKRRTSFTQIKTNKEMATQPGTSNHYSRTHHPLGLHTDSSYLPIPHQLVIFQVVFADDNGGDSILAPIDRIKGSLSAEVLACLRTSVFPFGQGTYPIIWASRTGDQIRYYRRQIDEALNDGATLDEHSLAALMELDHVLGDSEIFDRFHLNAGDVLFMQNRKVLHGRTGFSPDSGRLLFRYRLHAACLQ